MGGVAFGKRSPATQPTPDVCLCIQRKALWDAGQRCSEPAAMFSGVWAFSPISMLSDLELELF